MCTITVKKELDFADLTNECWSGAIDTLNTISEKDKEDELMYLLSEIFIEIPDFTEINDFLWFEDEYIFETLGIKTDDDDEDEEDDDDVEEE